MTGKRFNIHSDEDNERIWISDVQKHNEIEIQHYYGIATVVKMLNELHKNAKYWKQLAEGRLEQINQLKQKINTYNKVNELYKKENNQLKEALFFYISVAITETSSHINEDLEKECNQLLKCSYKEALEKYDTSKYEGV